jgi:hypothetical protein
VYSLEHDKAHPAEYYIMPPMGNDVLFGDVRVLTTFDGSGEIRVVVWPSCDLVTSGQRKPKVARISCVLARPLSELPEMKAWREAPDQPKRRQAIGAIVRNRRKGEGISEDRFHYLPAFGTIPDLVVDFQETDRLPVEVVSESKCLGTVASPFAEHLATRYLRYIGRDGIPDLDEEGLLNRMAARLGNPV